MPRSSKTPIKQVQSSSSSDDKKITRSKQPPPLNITASKLDDKEKEKLPTYLLPKKPARRKARKRKYNFGTHGSKVSEQKRLQALFKGKVSVKKEDSEYKVSGDTHESEHPIGFEPINKTNVDKRGKNGRTKNLENHAPAYQEVVRWHRKHIGTGNCNEPDESGFNSKSYRQAQRSLLLENEPGVAVQLNQLAYSQDKDFKFSKDVDQLQSNESFEQMARDVKEFNIADDYQDSNGDLVERNRTVNFQQGDFAEMMTSRATALLERYLNPMERTIFKYVIDQKIGFNAFLLACSTGNFDAILKEVGLEEYQDIFKEYYPLYRKDGRYNPEKEFEPKKKNDMDTNDD
jgi:hypothetical protein